MAEEEQAVEAPKVGKNKLIIILVAGIVGGGGAFWGMKMMGGGEKAPEPADTPAAPPTPVDHSDPTTAGPPPGGPGGPGAPIPDPPMGPIVDLDPFVVNLNEAGRARYLKMTVQLELQAPANALPGAPPPPIIDELEQLKPKIRHLLITYLSSLRVQDTKGPAAKMEICDHIRRRINNIVKTGSIVEVLLQDFVVR